MSDDDVAKRLFTAEFDDEFQVGEHETDRAYFGRDVLRGLIDGIGEFTHHPQPRWQTFRSDGPALLGSAMWINDAELIDRLGDLAAACVVVSKQGRRPTELRKLAPLAKLNERTPGMPIQAFSELTGLAPKENDRPVVIGPYSRMYDGSIPTIRTLGFRRTATPGGGMPPIIHAKMALLGHLWWHDEDDSPAGVVDVRGFTPVRLWISSANFTSSSRRSLEFGFWTENPDLLAGANRFLVKLMRSSEALDPASDSFDPDLAPVEFDDEAIWQAIGDMRYDGLAPDEWE
ncbi:hypothetical protein EAD96_30065 [Micromonospora sp. BL1]|uniref:hypothetical protein n=1 Tax=Micromonospora TaxID=1873 RepID=UPI000EF57319|nr:hypothetical protein [Micromonospora sp. BL1]RLP97285.1 hypothetical protein EAD96_30065 [Micromonospora sp. BL1]